MVLPMIYYTTYLLSTNTLPTSHCPLTTIYYLPTIYNLLSNLLPTYFLTYYLPNFYLLSLPTAYDLLPITCYVPCTRKDRLRKRGWDPKEVVYMRCEECFLYQQKQREARQSTVGKEEEEEEEEEDENWEKEQEEEEEEDEKEEEEEKGEEEEDEEDWGAEENEEDDKEDEEDEEDAEVEEEECHEDSEEDYEKKEKGPVRKKPKAKFTFPTVNIEVAVKHIPSTEVLLLTTVLLFI